MRHFSIKQLLVITVTVLPGMVMVLLLLSAVWNYIVNTQFSDTMTSQAAIEASQEAFTEQAAFQASEFRTKRAYQEAQNRYHVEQLRVRQDMLPRYAALKFYSAIAMLTILGLSLLIISSGYAGAKIRAASVCIARVGEHSEIPVHYHDLQSFYPIAVNLSLAEIHASLSTSHEQAYQLSRQMLEDMSNATRILAGKRGGVSSGTSMLSDGHTRSSGSAYASTFGELLRTGTIASDKPLVFGYNRQGQAHTCSVTDLKSVAVAGWQGSGKTRSMAYLVASLVLADKMQVYVIDPHHNHPESLSALLQPLEHTGYVSGVNPFHTSALIRDLNTTLDRRLHGQESCTPGIVLVIDELARLTTNRACFDVLVAFLERCTEETRTANITFIGSSHTWTARHFNGRADIRGCMHSMLIHKTKPSQADLLLEDSTNTHLVKHVHHPGEAILVTDDGMPTMVSMPLCTREDMHTVANMLGTVKNDEASFDAQQSIPLTNWDGTTPLFETIPAERFKMASQA